MRSAKHTLFFMLTSLFIVQLNFL